jgi:hypothetical protein
MNGKTNSARVQPDLENWRSDKIPNLVMRREQLVVAKRLECGRFTAAFTRAGAVGDS